jgi:FkbM family methyltransferase
MTYLDSKFLKHLKDINTIIEVGARYGDETIELSKNFKNSKVYSFECNPLTIQICKNNLENLENIFFYDFALGDKDEILPFYSYHLDNDGASSLYKRIDFDETQIFTGNIIVKKLVDFVKKENIVCIDFLCMDCQGYELNVLKGAEDFIKNIRYIIMEEPNPIINTTYLPEGIHSKYLDAPSSQQIQKFMNDNGFYEVERITENFIEDNVMYENKNYESSII